MHYISPRHILLFVTMPLDKRRWTSASELPWLVACIPEYLEAQKKSKYHKFWAPFFEQYFSAYPVRDATEADQSDSGSESDCDSDAPLDTEEEEVFSTTAAGKRKQKTKKTKANKRAKKARAALHYVYATSSNI